LPKADLPLTQPSRPRADRSVPERLGTRRGITFRLVTSQGPDLEEEYSKTMSLPLETGVKSCPSCFRRAARRRVGDAR